MGGFCISSFRSRSAAVTSTFESRPPTLEARTEHSFSVVDIWRSDGISRPGGRHVTPPPQRAIRTLTRQFRPRLQPTADRAMTGSPTSG